MTTNVNYDQSRQQMVDRQLAARGIRDPKVLEAMRKIPRHRFVGENMQLMAYDDRALPIDLDQTISQPYMVALMTEAMELSGDDKVLEIGTGSGYQAAVLAEICREVYTVEKYPELMERATSILSDLGYDNVVGKVGDGTLGWPEHQPYDAIVVTAGAPHVPQALLDQLVDGGRLIIPVGDRFIQELKKLTRKDGRISEDRLVGCQFVPLRGEEGWH